MSGDVTIEVHPEKCTGCLICQLCCSLIHHKTFNPSMARILVRLTDDSEIIFTDDCDKCGTCARFCVYGALEVKEVRD